MLPSGIDLIISMALDVSRALHYLHSCGLVHGSLSSKKVMVCNNHRAKLLYTPVESAKPRESPPSEGDVFHMGLIMCEMALGKTPHPSEVELCSRDITWPRLREIIRRCVDSCTDARLTTDELCQQLLRISR